MRVRDSVLDSLRKSTLHKFFPSAKLLRPLIKIFVVFSVAVLCSERRLHIIVNLSIKSKLLKEEGEKCTRKFYTDGKIRTPIPANSTNYSL